MDLKLRIILVIFIFLLIGYAIYFVINQFHKQKAKDNLEKNTTETFENYDVRKYILNQLDIYDIDKNKKSAIYDSLNNKMDDIKDMSQEKLHDFIKELVMESKSISSSSKDIKDKILNEIKQASTTSSKEDYEQKEDDGETSDEEIETFNNDMQSTVRSIDTNIQKLTDVISSLTNTRDILNDSVKPVNRNQSIQISEQQRRINERRRTPVKGRNQNRVFRKTNKSTQQIQNPIIIPEASTSNNNIDIDNTQYYDETNDMVNQPQNQYATENQTQQNDQLIEDVQIEGFKNYSSDWYSYI